MKIYRIESYELECPSNPKFMYAGPFNMTEKWIHSIYTKESHPTPKDDEDFQKHLRKHGWNRKHYCCFSSMTQLIIWFSYKELASLHSLGFIIAEYESNEVLHGEKQSLFLPQNKRNSIKEINTLINSMSYELYKEKIA